MHFAVSPGAASLLREAGVPLEECVPFLRGEAGKWLNVRGAMETISEWRRRRTEWNQEDKIEGRIDQRHLSPVLREDQKEAVVSSFGKSGLLIAPAGWGKTAAGCELIRLFAKEEGKPCIVVAPSVEILRQWKEWCSLLGVKDVSFVGGGDGEDEGGGMKGETKQGPYLGRGHLSPPSVTLLTYSMLTGGKEFKSQSHLLQLKANWYGVLVLDEVHHLPAKTYRRSVEGMKKLLCQCKIGLTATPYREDCCCESALTKLVGPILFEKRRGKGGKGENEGGSDAPRVICVPLPPILHEAYERAKGFKKRLFAALNPCKTALLSQTLFEERRKAVVYVQILHALDVVMDVLTKSVPEGWIIGPLNGSTPERERQRMYASFREREGACILLTTDVSSSGIDLPDCDCVVEMTSDSSRSKCHQRWGRAMRVKEGKRVPLILTLVSKGTHEDDTSEHRAGGEDVQFEEREDVHVPHQVQTSFLSSVEAYVSSSTSKRQRRRSKGVGNKRVHLLKEKVRRCARRQSSCSQQEQQ